MSLFYVVELFFLFQNYVESNWNKDLTPLDYHERITVFI